MGRRVFTGRPCDLVVRGQIERLSGTTGFAATMTLIGRDGEPLGERRLESRDRTCAALGGPASLVIALMVEAGKSRVSLVAPPDPSPKESPPEPHLEAVQGMTTLFSALMAVSNLLPGVSIGQGFDIGFTPAHFVPVRAGATFYWPTSSERGGRGGTLWAWHAGLSVCPELTASRITSLAVCAGLQGGAMHGTGFGLDYDESSTLPYVHSDAKLVGSVRIIGSLGVYAQLGMAVPVLSGRFVYLSRDRSPEEVFHPAPLVGFGGLGIVLKSDASAEVRADVP